MKRDGMSGKDKTALPLYWIIPQEWSYYTVHSINKTEYSTTLFRSQNPFSLSKISPFLSLSYCPLIRVLVRLHLLGNSEVHLHLISQMFLLKSLIYSRFWPPIGQFLCCFWFSESVLGNFLQCCLILCVLDEKVNRSCMILRVFVPCVLDSEILVKIADFFSFFF